jgi:PAS domain S-box-containing protein
MNWDASSERAMHRGRMKALKQAASQYKAGDLEAFYETLTVTSFRNSRISVTLANPDLPDCPLVGVSQGFEQMTGYSRAEIIGRNCRFLNHGCPMPKQTRHDLRVATRSLKGFIGVLVNRRKGGQIFKNLLRMSMLRVGNRKFLLGVQADVTNSDADLQIEEHRQELNRLVDNIFAAHVDTWAAIQDACFRIERIPTLTPYTVSQLIPNYDDQNYAEARDTFISLAPVDGFATTMGCHNTFIEVSINEPGSLLNRLRCVSSEPVLSSPATPMGPSVPDSMRLPAHLLRDSLRQLRLCTGQAPLPDLSPEEAVIPEAAAMSKGSVDHPDGCTPCAFYCYSKGGCNKGEACLYCHMAHPRRTRRRGKKKPKISSGAFGSEQDPGEDLTQDDEDIGGREKEVAIPSPTPADLMPLLNALQFLSPLPAARGEPLCDGGDPVSSQGAGTVDTDRDSSFPSEAEPSLYSSSEAERIGFWYSERSIVVALGQPKQVIPFLGSPRRGKLVFSVSPPLPRGFSLHRENGVISGSASQLTDVNGTEHTITVQGDADGTLPGGDCISTSVHFRVLAINRGGSSNDEER